ncbi:MAG: D-alanine--D-alanine ligase [Candidatus Omnitrophica bacterium]|nr:D-alanine--D-alanine ligase [Candidatus Omnitrophota bacterium]
MDLTKIKVGVLGGGISKEREISLDSANQAMLSLKRSNIDAVLIDIKSCDERGVRALLKESEIDLAFIALHGEFGEDGGVQIILEQMNIAYTGSPPAASRLAMDKVAAKNIFLKNKIPTPLFTVHTNCQGYLNDVEFPVVVKPCSLGSSLGISIANDADSLKCGLIEALKMQNKVIVESYIQGRELTVGILEDSPLGVVEIIPKGGFYDFTNKYIDEKTEFIAPAKLDEETKQKIKSIALNAHVALGCGNFSRVDIRLSHDKIPYVLEVNSIPGLTAHSLLPLSAKCCNIDFDQLIIKMTQI